MDQDTFNSMLKEAFRSGAVSIEVDERLDNAFVVQIIDQDGEPLCSSDFRVET